MVSVHGIGIHTTATSLAPQFREEGGDVSELAWALEQSQQGAFALTKCIWLRGTAGVTPEYHLCSQSDDIGQGCFNESEAADQLQTLGFHQQSAVLTMCKPIFDSLATNHLLWCCRCCRCCKTLCVSVIDHCYQHSMSRLEAGRSLSALLISNKFPFPGMHVCSYCLSRYDCEKVAAELSTMVQQNNRKLTCR